MGFFLLQGLSNLLHRAYQAGTAASGVPTLKTHKDKNQLCFLLSTGPEVALAVQKLPWVSVN